MKTDVILKGDCYQLIKDIPNKSIDLIYTDIPYLYEKGGGGYSKIATQIKKITNELNDADITNGINWNILDEFVRVMKYIYIYMV